MAEQPIPTDFPTIFDPATCVRKGLCPVMAIRGQQETPLQSHSVYFEQHGTGGEKIVLIMGLNTSSFAWGKQVQHFTKNHSVLVLDNRGVGNSDSPKGPYTTSGLADDVIALLDYVGWNKGRELHLVGVSMGGMITQELALKIPERILSISLIVTKAGSAGFWANRPPLKGVFALGRIMLSSDDANRADLVLSILYPEAWLDAPSTLETANGKTNRQVFKEELLRRMSIQRKQTLTGSLAQTAAASNHNVTPEQLQLIAKNIPKILILTGDSDDLINPVNSEWLAKHMPGADYQVWAGTAHGLIGQEFQRFNELMEKVIAEGREKGSQAPFA